MERTPDDQAADERIADDADREVEADDELAETAEPEAEPEAGRDHEADRE